MDKRNYDVLPLFLSFTAFFVSSLYCIVRILELFDVVSEQSIFILHIWKGSAGILFWGWLPGLIFALISFGMLRRSQHFLRSVVACSISTVALLLSIFWASDVCDMLFHKPF